MIIFLHRFGQAFLWNGLGNEPRTQVEPMLDGSGAGKEVTNGEEGLCSGY